MAMEGRGRIVRSEVHLWRRSYDIPPPALRVEDPRYPGHDPRYQDLDPQAIPLTECRKDTVSRFLLYWHETIPPTIRSGKRVLIGAHGNSLRALVKYLDNVSDNDVVELNIATGVRLVYELDADVKPLTRCCLGDSEAIRTARDAVAKQGNAKG